MNMRGLAAVAVLLSVAFGGRAAQATGRDAKERAAKKACLAGDFNKGVELLADLYLDSNDPNYIFNQARCLEQNHRYEDSLSRFREFLVKAVNPSEQVRAETEKHIAACQSYLSSKGTEAQPVAPTGGPVPAPVVVPQPHPEPVPSPGLSVSQLAPNDTLLSAALCDPGVGSFSTAGQLLTARYQHTATLLPNGKVLVVGGRDNGV